MLTHRFQPEHVCNKYNISEIDAIVKLNIKLQKNVLKSKKCLKRLAHDVRIR